LKKADFMSAFFFFFFFLFPLSSTLHEMDDFQD